MPDDGRLNPRDVFAAGETPSGTTAFLQALMSMLGEVLDRVDGRLSSLETTLAERSDPAPAILPDPVDDSKVVAALERISERIGRLEARESEGITTQAAMNRLADLAGYVDDVGRHVADLAAAVASSGAEEWREGLRNSLAAVWEGLAGMRAELTAQKSESAAERNQEMTDIVAALERMSERLEALEAREPEASLTSQAATALLADLSGSVDDVGRRVAGLADVVTETSEAGQEWPEGLQASLGAVSEALAGMRSQMTAQANESAEERSQEMTNVVAALERVFERLERLEEREPEGPSTESTESAELIMTRLADLSGSVDDVGRRLAGVADIVAASSEADDQWPEGLSTSLAALGEGIAGIRLEVATQGTERAEMAERDERDEERNQEMANLLDALERLGDRIGQLEQREPDGLGLERTMARLDELSTAVDSIGYGMAGMADLMNASAASAVERQEWQQEWPEGLRAALLALGEGVVELRQDLHVQPVGELRGTVRRLEGQLALLTNQLAAQPGPGAAVAMVAAGLAERFEERTEALTELLGVHAAYVRQTWERIEGILDGGGFDELAVGDALEHVIANQEAMADSVERLIGRLEDLQSLPQAAGNGPAREALEKLGAGMEGVGVRVDDVRRRLAALATALEASSHEAGPEPGPRDAGDASDAGDPASVAGRRATTGRRLASDLGLRGRGRSPR